MLQNDLDWFAARLSLAVYDTNRESPEMSVYELKQALRDIPGIETLTIGHAKNGNQILHIDGRSLEVSPMASNDEIRLALQNPFIRTENTKMSITGASHLSASIKDKINAAKARMASVSDGTDKALAKFNVAADSADKVNKSIEAEAEALLAEIGQFTNGAPE